jgi:hypothetical protein
MGHKFAQNFEASNPSDDQHAYRPHRQAIDAAMLKLLTMECARFTHTTMANMQFDSKACFDRINRTELEITLRKNGTR